MFCVLRLFIILDSKVCYINMIFVFSFVGSVFHNPYYIIIYKDMMIILDLMFYYIIYRYIIGSM
jgi:hypothetical protein